MSGVDLRELFDLAHPLARVQSWPRTVVERLSRGGDRGVDVCRGGGGSLADRLFGMRGDDRYPVPGGRLAPMSSHEKLVIATVITGFRHWDTTSEKATAIFAIDANIAKKPGQEPRANSEGRRERRTSGDNGRRRADRHDQP